MRVEPELEAAPRGGGERLTWPRAALLSLSDKRGALELARGLAEHGTRLLASGGTAKHLAESGLPVTTVEDWTGFPEMMGGRVKTLHPHVHGAILARRAMEGDVAELAKRGLVPIDLVAVSLYPFEERAASLDDAAALEEVDIGGVALLRAAAKNYPDVIVAHSPDQYPEIIAALRAGGPSAEQRREWAASAFARTARYDAAIAADLARRRAPDRDEPPALYFLALERARSLRYGENPHQPAALYARPGEAAKLDAWREGKALSFNNLLDLDAAVGLVWQFDTPACVIVKHNQPCGAACAATLGEAYERALRSDELSAYGGIVAFNRPLDGATATQATKPFVECVAAPDFAPEAKAAFEAKKNLRAVRLSAEDLRPADPWSVRLVGKWALLQREPEGPAPAWNCVTSRAPTPAELHSLEFAWKVAAVARSNAIVLAHGTALVGLGAGQTSRVDAVDVALMKARRAGHDVKGATLASDGFFPFADNIEHAAAAGITAVVQPGGSMRDAEVVAACDAHGIAMMFTDRRVFKH